MFLIVGLGNPGTKYESNRHNIGFLAVESIARTFGASAWVTKFSGSCAYTGSSEDRIYFLKPETYMNLSGESVGAAARFFKIPTENVIVLHDELDLPEGKLRVKQGGGDGGHNGIKSIDSHLGSNYWRVRIGIGRPVHGDVSNYVLSDFSNEEWIIQQKLLHNICDHFSLLLKKDDAGFMNKVALATKE